MYDIHRTEWIKEKHFFHLWWVDVGWMPGVHKAALPLPSLAGWGEKIKWKNTSGVKIKAV